MRLVHTESVDMHSLSMNAFDRDGLYLKWAISIRRPEGKVCDELGFKAYCLIKHLKYRERAKKEFVL